MKKILCCALALLMMLSLCACSIKDMGKSKETQNAKITLSTYEVTLNFGNTFQLEATADDVNNYMWKSSNEDVVLVNSKGVVTAVGYGVANVTCYADGADEAVCTVTVKGAKPVQTTTAKTELPEENGRSMIFPHSSTAYLSEAEIAETLADWDGFSPTGKYAQDAINEIYARNGYVFKNATIAKYYNSLTWYIPDPNFKTSALNKYEQKNIALLKKYLPK